ncbi:MAG: anti-sigma factor domain-containing protein [Clostridiales bacterium]|nr:anti-sigma factor domain-containing protein [Clostridiales bacterium]
MNKGVIVEIKDKYCVVMARGLETKKIIKKEDCSIGQEVYFLPEDVISTISSDWRKYAIAVVLMLAVSVSAYAYQLQNAVYTVVSLDINPSVELSLNRNDVVIALEGLNEDGLAIIDEDMIGQDVEEVLQQLVENSKKDEYLQDDGFVLLSTVEKKNDDDSIDARLQEIIEGNPELYAKVNVVVLEATEEDLDAADDEGISVGLYQLEKLEKEINPTAAANRTQVMSVKEFFYGLQSEDIDALENQEMIKQMNKKNMKDAIELHKEAMKDEINDRKDENGTSDKGNSQNRSEEQIQAERDQEDAVEDRDRIQDETKKDDDKGKPENPGKSNENKDSNDDEDDEVETDD